MGIFNTTLASNKKSKLMKELILIMEKKREVIWKGPIRSCLIV